MTASYSVNFSVSWHGILVQVARRLAKKNRGAHNCTGWRRLIGYLNLQVIFRQRATNYWALLRKMTYEDKASYDSTPSCMMHCRQSHTYSHAHVHTLSLARARTHAYARTHANPPAPMNHVKIFKGWPPRDAPSELVQLWYKIFPPDHIDQVEKKNQLG